MTIYCNSSFIKNKQTGAVLFVALIMLLVLTVIGLSAAQRSNLQERMGANTHVQNVAFNAAESALGAVLLEANAGADKKDHEDVPGNIIYEARQRGAYGPFCYDSTGVKVDCASKDTWLDATNKIEARANVVLVSGCEVPCAGYSIGKTTGCTIYDITANGTVGGKSGSVDALHEETNLLSVREFTSCIN